jgi:signal transduction histidine kinase
MSFGPIMRFVVGGRALGVFVVADGPEGGRLTRDDERLLFSFAAGAANAVHNAKSVEAERLRLSIEASERERQRWARELHDETLQGLGALRILLSSSLRGSNEKLANAVREAIEHLTGPARLEPEVEGALYRLAQEALTNVVNHAGASRVEIFLTRRDGAVELRISDDGTGFEIGEPHDGFGLVGMRERAALTGGPLEITSERRGGTTVRALIPLEAGSARAAGGTSTKAARRSA